MPTIQHISHSDAGGGAAIAMWRLHKALRSAGHRSNVAVASKRSMANEVDRFFRVPITAQERLDKRISAWRMKREHRRYDRTRLPTLELFSDDRVPGPDALSEQLPPADVYNLHWVAGFVDYIRFFDRLGPDAPMVWTLHDMNPFTGGCHYTLGCDRFTDACGACPQLGSADDRDLSRRILARKTQALAARRPEKTRIVSPSRWLAEEARRSALFSRFDVEVIPNGIDCETFQPRSRAAARDVFGLPQDKPVLLFVADSVNNHRKGFDLLLEALATLPGGLDVTLAAVGGLRKDAPLPPNTVSLGRIENERLMSFAYSAADAFVLPTRSEAFGLVVLEAMACGVPVISFDVGGLPDMVTPGETGLLAPPESVEGLRSCILQALSDGEACRAMGARARARAHADFAAEKIAQRYLQVYEALTVPTHV